MKILFGVKVGEPDWAEQLITEQEEQIPAARKWASENGFNRLRVVEIDNNPPDFAGTVKL